MAIPFSFSNVQFPFRNYNCGPWKAANGGIYVLFLDTGDYSIEIHKCEDYDFPVTTAFSEQDDTGAPTKVCSLGQCVWGYLSGNKIHVVSWFDDGIDNWYYYHAFDTSSDTWTAIDQVIDTWEDKYEPDDSGCSFIFRENDGGQDPYVCFYNGPAGKIGGTYYERVSYATDADGTGAWANAGNAVDAGGEINYTGAVAVRGSVPDSNGHVLHVFFKLSTGTSGYCRTLRHTGVAWGLSSTVTCPGTLSSSDTHPFSPGIYYDDSGTDRVLIAFIEDSTNDLNVWMIPEDSSGDADAANDAEYAVDDNFDVEQTGQAVACLAIDNISGKAYCLWGEKIGGGSDLIRSDAAAPYSSWASGTELKAGTCYRISCNVYPRNGSLKVAFIWLDDSTIKYDEYDIGAETAPALTAARFPQQNFKVGPEKV